MRINVGIAITLALFAGWLVPRTGLAATPGAVQAWGSNANGQLGDSTTVDRTVPDGVSGLTGVVGIAADDGYSMALVSDGTARARGFNSVGQLDNGTRAGRAHRFRFRD